MKRHQSIQVCTIAERAPGGYLHAYLGLVQFPNLVAKNIRSVTTNAIKQIIEGKCSIGICGYIERLMHIKTGQVTLLFTMSFTYLAEFLQLLFNNILRMDGKWLSPLQPKSSI
jgi:hypothetical protein